ncbi:hypothetical protein ACEWY4_003055 [Coilia grayii]|uniref:Ig-like domain-containing protein n=1 Tax=Coilia grayii TaxID=363190 RepID=A0ABD1KQ53_9TELE
MVTVSCSVSHSCPPHPPTFTWSHNGNVTTQSKPLNNGQHKLTSNLTFTANDDRQNITCTARHHGGKTASTSFTIAEYIVIKVVPVVAILLIGTAVLVGIILCRKCKSGQRSCPEMTDEVYANCVAIKADKDLDDEDIYANTEFLQSQEATMEVIQGLGSPKEPDDDIYANM